MNLDRMKQKQEESRKRKASYGKEFWFPTEKKGGNNIRILPHWTGDLDADCYYETAYHKNIGEENKSVVCVKMELKEQCVACDLVAELWKTKEKEDIAYAKKIKAQIRVYWNMVDLDDVEKGVQVWMTGSDVLDQVVDWCTNPKYGDITDPVHGRNCVLQFTAGEHTRSGYNEYKLMPDPSESMIDVGLLENMTDLTTFIKITPNEEVTKLLFGEKATPTTTPPIPPPIVPPTPPVIASDKPCFTNAKFSGDDEECMTCSTKDPCRERKEAKRAIPKSETKVEQPTAAPAVTSVPEKSKGDKEQEIRNMLANIKNKQKK